MASTIVTFLLSYNTLKITGVIKSKVNYNSGYNKNLNIQEHHTKILPNNINNINNLYQKQNYKNDSLSANYQNYSISHQYKSPSKYFIPEPTASPNMISELEEMFEEINKYRIEAQEKSIKWALEFIKNPNITQRTQEVYRLRLIKSLHLAHKALEENNFEEAIKLYEEALKDPLATPVTKYITYDYLIYAAKKTKDIQRYAKYLLEQASLAEEENLEVLGIQKEKGIKKWAEKKVKLLLASKDKKIYNELLNARLKESNIKSDKSKELIAAFLNQEIESAHNNFYKDLNFE